ERDHGHGKENGGPSPAMALPFQAIQTLGQRVPRRPNHGGALPRNTCPWNELGSFWLGGRDGRTPAHEAGRVLPGAGRGEDGRFREGPADELESNGKAGGREATGHGDGGHSREAGRRGIGAAA